jgi:predicted dithiol-disulfide oxidoreductase (DUF899 family)
MDPHNLKPDKMEPHKVVSHDEWIAARKAYLVEEKTFSKARDARPGRYKSVVPATEIRLMRRIAQARNFISPQHQQRRTS